MTQNIMKPQSARLIPGFVMNSGSFLCNDQGRVVAANARPLGQAVAQKLLVRWWFITNARTISPGTTKPIAGTK